MQAGRQDLSESFKMFITVGKYISRTAEETMNIGHDIGLRLRPGAVVGLYGELGTGKTVLVKGIARAFGISERDVISASFTIVTEYQATVPFTHIDLYRIEKSEELIEIGISEQLGGEKITVIEWAEKAEEWLPEGSIAVRLQCLEDGTREITVEGLNE